MRMVMVAGRRHLVGTVRRRAVVVVVSVLVAMVAEMGGMVLRVFQHVANAHDRRIGCVQRENDGKKKNQESTHGTDYISNPGTLVDRISVSDLQPSACDEVVYLLT